MTITCCKDLKGFFQRRYRDPSQNPTQERSKLNSAQNARTAYTTEKSFTPEAVHLSDYARGNEVIQSFTYTFSLKEAVQTFLG